MKQWMKVLTAATALTSLAVGSAVSQPANDLKIDPLLLVSLKECRNIAKSLGSGLYPGWDFAKTPVLFYRPKVQELLINFPHQPKGFSLYAGFNPLGEEPIYVRNDTTLFDVDDQNTSREIEGIPVLVVADPASRMRNQLRGVLTKRSKEFAGQWLEDWNLLESPYSELQLILHEAFHVYQNKMAPEKRANEAVITQYPLLDPVNNALYVLEGNILKDALLAQNPKERLEKVKTFVAVRSFRQSRLDSSWVEYENLNEFAEGTAKYMEYKFLKAGESIEPTPEMYYHVGFNGYRGVLTKKFDEAMRNMVNIVAVNDDRFGNKYGSGPLRFKLYELGACQALLLDEVMPAWKEKIFAQGVYLCYLLKQAAGLSAAERETYLQRAKAEYRYDDAYRDKLQFETDGKKMVEEKLASILQTDRTLVEISYEGFVDRIGLGGFTPFGVTQVSKRCAIYDLVPIRVRFKEGVELQMKQVVPVLIDREKKLIAFAASTPAAQLAPAGNKLETGEFVLSRAQMQVQKHQNKIEIRLK